MADMIFKLGRLGWSVIISLSFLILGKFFNKAVEKFTIKNSFTLDRANRIKRFIDVFFLILLIITVTLVWGFNLRDFFLAMATVFTIIGTAFFAAWSNLSNISSGIIIFFSYKLKVGDRVALLHGDNRMEGVIHEMKLFYIEITTNDGDTVIYPNNLILHNSVRIIAEKQKST